MRISGFPTSPPCTIRSTRWETSNTSGRSSPWVSEMTPSLRSAPRRRASRGPGPPLDEVDLEPQLIDDALYHEVDEISDLLRVVIKAWRRGQHERPRFAGECEIAEVHEG